MKVLSPELAIGGRADAHFLLLPDQLSDVLIFKLLQVPPYACFRASKSSLGRRNEPLWSPRNGGFSLCFTGAAIGVDVHEIASEGSASSEQVASMSAAVNPGRIAFSCSARCQLVYS